MACLLLLHTAVATVASPVVASPGVVASPVGASADDASAAKPTDTTATAPNPLLATLPSPSPAQNASQTPEVKPPRATVAMDANLPYLCRGKQKKRLHRELSGGSDRWATIVINGIDFLIDMTKMKLFGTVDEKFEEPPPEPQPKLDDTAVASDGGDSSDHSVVGDVGADGKPNAAGPGAAQALAASAATSLVHLNRLNRCWHQRLGSLTRWRTGLPRRRKPRIRKTRSPMSLTSIRMCHSESLIRGSSAVSQLSSLLAAI